MLFTWFAALAAAAVLAGASACGGSSSHPAAASAARVSSSPTSAPASAPTSAASATTATSGTPTAGGPSFVKGGAALADNDVLVTVLEAVNPKIGTSKDELVARSKALCAHINEPGAQLDAAATKGFTNGSWVPSPAEAEAIVGTVKAYGGC